MWFELSEFVNAMSLKRFRGVRPVGDRTRSDVEMNPMNTKTLFASILAAGVALSVSGAAFAQNTTPAKDKTVEKQPAQEKGKQGEKGKEWSDKDTKEKKDKDKKDKDKKVASAPAIGDVAPTFTLTDTEGKTHNLADMTKEGKIVVIQWFNADCPFVVKHYKNANTFNDMAAKYSAKDVVFIAVNSSAPGEQGSGKDRNIKAKNEWKMPYPILLDPDGTVGRAYGAKNTPAMYIISKTGTVAYHGAIDDDRSADGIGKTNYVAKALDEMLAGQSVSTASTQPYGCSVKYKKD